jgi:dTDP-4-amino-4,6-dideoxygalactose transaminase
VTEDLSSRLVRLPLFHDLCETDQSRVVQELERFLRQDVCLPVQRRSA